MEEEFFSTFMLVRGGTYTNEKGKTPMSMMTILLLIILIVLVVIVVLMFTVWPRRQSAEIEKAVSALRREMAEHRGDSIRLVQAIRNEVEDAVLETLQHEITDLFRRGAGQTSFQRPIDASADPASKKRTTENSAQRIEVSMSAEKPARQMSLFQEQTKSKQLASSETPEESKPDGDTKDADTEPMERVQAVLHDDIPDIDDLPDLEDSK
ncbi:MAG: hypothetical protein MI684_07090 [Chlorobiales bacterium]|nr:hypothetical protein [Chlorobiales bacterium]